MPKPQPEPIPPDQVLAHALAVVKHDRFPMLASMDGDQPRVRPISPLRTDGFNVYFASLRAYHKTGELAQNPKVELAYMDDRHDQVRITGDAEMVTDPEVRQSIWDDSPLLRQYLGDVHNPQFLLYKVTPTDVRYMQEWALEYYDVPFEDAASSD
ncbi:MAG: pyridoxamine 5-phosphate oxidase [Phycisphaera sp.]|nr:pyridoxamine 5-phosphate oxidase [Phycisphaera sp.]